MEFEFNPQRLSINDICYPLATGQVQVLRIINGLGHGLDQEAMLAASHIRFKPATKNGEPIDQVSVVHISFQFA